MTKQRELNRRQTRQRDAIREVFAEQIGPLSPAEVLEYARTKVDGIGIATVYRTLKIFQDEGWLVPVELPGGRQTLFERAGQRHHHYFRCRECDNVLVVRDCPPNLDRLIPDGCTLEDHEIVLYGLCRSCREVC